MKGVRFRMKWKQFVTALLTRLGLLRPGGVYYIGGAEVLPPPLTPPEEAEALARLMEAGFYKI